MDTPVRITHVRVNSKYRTSGTTSSFTCTYACPELRQCTSIALMSFTMTRSYFNVQSFNNSLVFNLNGTRTEKIVPPGEYDAAMLVQVLNTFFQNTVYFEIVSSNGYDRLKASLFQQSVFPTTFSFDPTSSTMAPVLGLGWFLLNQSSPTYTSSLPFSLDGPGLYVQLQGICDTSTCESAGNNPNSGWIPLLAKIATSYETSFGDHIVYEPHVPMEIRFDSLSPRSLQTLQVQLTDVYGNLHELPENTYCDFLLRVAYV